MDNKANSYQRFLDGDESAVADFESYGVYYRIAMKFIPHTLLEDVLLEDTIREIATRWHFGDKGVMEESQ